ncbi:dihydrofolate reductase [Patescibacteria group bacterium]|nr:dihydrofolate reductase [Patescibacteria group bacterium]
MKISIVVAVDVNNGIGYMGKIPWHLPEDLKRFKEITMGHHVLMGRLTWESINKPLKGRNVIVLTRKPEEYHPRNEPVLVTDNLEKAIEYAKSMGENELMVAGGSEVYKQTIDIADKIYLTKILEITTCDTFFPTIDYRRWKVREEKLKTSKYVDFYYKELVKVQPRF